MDDIIIYILALEILILMVFVSKSHSKNREAERQQNLYRDQVLRDVYEDNRRLQEEIIKWISSS